MFIWSKGDLIILPICLMVMLLTTFLIWFFLKDKSEKIKTIPLVVITVIMLVLEIIKQIISIKEGYDMWKVPLHFCSLFLYFYPIAVFAKGKFQEFGKTMSLVCSTWLLVLFYIRPGSIIGDEYTKGIFLNFGTFHTFTYHHLALLFLFVSLSLKFYNLTKMSYVYIVIGFTIYAIVGFTVAHLTNTNYCNLLHNNFEPFENFRLNYGQILYSIFMYLSGVLGGLAMCGLYRTLYKFNFRNKKIKYNKDYIG